MPGLNAELAKYPDASGAQVEVFLGMPVSKDTPAGRGVPVRWPVPEVSGRHGEPYPAELAKAEVIKRVPTYGLAEEHWLVPVVGDGQDTCRLSCSGG